MNFRYALTELRAGRRCEYCRAPEAVFNFRFEVEHIVPVACDGPDQESNWALSCRSCNLRNAIHLNGVDPESGRTMRLYDPRRDRWARNFRFDTKTGRIEGLRVEGEPPLSGLG